jgi:hypothetical protein
MVDEDDEEKMVDEDEEKMVDEDDEDCAASPPSSPSAHEHDSDHEESWQPSLDSDTGL